MIACSDRRHSDHPLLFLFLLLLPIRDGIEHVMHLAPIHLGVIHEDLSSFTFFLGLFHREHSKTTPKCSESAFFSSSQHLYFNYGGCIQLWCTNGSPCSKNWLVWRNIFCVVPSFDLFKFLHTEQIINNHHKELLSYDIPGQKWVVPCPDLDFWHCVWHKH